MFIINDLENNVIDLEGLKEYDKEFEVLSLNDKGKRQPFSVELVTNENIKISVLDVNIIKIIINVQAIVNEEFIVFKNYIGEKINISVKPNMYFVDDKEYKFKVTKSEIRENGDLRLKILSKVNGEEIGWKCIYNGKPVSYSITPMENTKSCFITIKLLSQLFVDYTSTLMFEQEESGEIIEYKIYNTPDGMKKAD